MSWNLRITLLVLAALVVSGGSLATGQTPVAAQPGAPLDGVAQLMLIRNTLTLVNHGNLTGNYTVLRDLSTAQFRQRNTAADLAATFANLRQQKLDLSPVLVIQPQLTQPAEIVDGRMHLAGVFPTRPQAVQFSLAFQQVEAGWMIDEVSLRVAPAETRPPPAVTTKPSAAAEYRPAPSYLPQTSEVRKAERDLTRPPLPSRPR
jgi:hypothetical protein